jgi:hypothetical protein
MTTEVPRCDGGRQQFGERALVEEGVAARAQHHVDVGVLDEAGEHLGLVHARADRADDALRAELLQGRIALAEGLFGVVVRVVEVDDVDPVEAEPFQAGLQAAAYAVGAEVPDAAVCGGHGEAVGEVVAVPRPLGSRRRPTLVEIVYSARGRSRRAAPRRRSERPMP